MKKVLLSLLVIFCLTGCSFFEFGSGNGDDTDELSLFHSNLIAVSKDGKWGYVNSENETVIQFLYDEAYAFLDGYAVVESGNKMFIIDTEGKNVLGDTYDEIYRDKETGLAFYYSNGLWGLIDVEGTILSDALYDDINSFSEGLARVRSGDNYGYIDSSGKAAISLEYENANDFSQGLAAVSLDGKWGYIDEEGNTIIDFLYDSANSFDLYDRARVYVMSSNEWHLIDKTGYMYINEQNIVSGTGPIYAAGDEDGYYLYDASGNKLVDDEYQVVYGMYDYLMYAKNSDGQYVNVWLNEDGTVFQEVEESEGYFWNQLYMKFDSEQFLVIYDDEYLDVYTKEKTYRIEGDDISQVVSGSRLIVIRDGMYGVVDESGDTIVEFLYDELVWMNDDYVLYFVNNKIGVMNSDFETIITAQYDEINVFFDDGYSF